MENLERLFENNMMGNENIQLFNSLLQQYNNDYFQRRTREEYISIHNSNIEKRKNEISQIEDNNNLQMESLIDIEKYNPLGKNIEDDFTEIKIKELKINSYHNKKYLILKIISKLLVVKSTNFIGEDSNKDVIHVSIYKFRKIF